MAMTRKEARTVLDHARRYILHTYNIEVQRFAGEAYVILLRATVLVES